MQVDMVCSGISSKYFSTYVGNAWDGMDSVAFVVLRVCTYVSAFGACKFLFGIFSLLLWMLYVDSTVELP